MQDHASPRDDRVLVPLAVLDVGAQLSPVPDHSHQLRNLAGQRLHHLSAPGDNPPRGVLRIELSAVLLRVFADGVPEVSLRPDHHPARIQRRLALASHTARRNAGAAPVLDAAAPAPLHLDLEIEIEVLRFDSVVDQEAVPRILLRGRLADDGPIFHAPHPRLAVPSGQSLAVEERCVSSVVREVDRVRLKKDSVPLARDIRLNFQ